MNNKNKRPTALNNKALLLWLQPFELISYLKKNHNFCCTISIEIWNILSEGSRFQYSATFYIKQMSGAQWKENKMQITSNTLLLLLL